MDHATQQALDHYITDLYATEDDALRAIQQSTVENDMPQISLQPHEGRLLQFLVEISRAKRAVEIGTLAGYSGTWIAQGLPDDGQLITLEVSSKHADVARQNFAAAGLTQKVEVRQGDAKQLMTALSSEGPFDFIFVDADKDSYPQYIDWAIDNLGIGGVLAYHNALGAGRVLDPGSSDYGRNVDYCNQRIADDPSLSAYLIGVGDGLAAALKIS